MVSAFLKYKELTTNLLDLLSFLLITPKIPTVLQPAISKALFYSLLFVYLFVPVGLITYYDFDVGSTLWPTQFVFSIVFVAIAVGIICFWVYAGLLSPVPSNFNTRLSDYLLVGGIIIFILARVLVFTAGIAELSVEK
jgi:hypothetical protein